MQEPQNQRRFMHKYLSTNTIWAFEISLQLQIQFVGNPEHMFAAESVFVQFAVYLKCGGLGFV